MKISEFSNKYNISNDTVRYYMELNLIVPVKKGGHYYFDKDCEEDIKEVLRLKEMNFTLQEIKEIFNFKRIGKLTPYQKNSYYQNLYKNKIAEIKKDIKQLKSAKDSLKEEIKFLKENKIKENNKFGINLDVLYFFSCPDCKSSLKLSADKVIDNQILNGQLSCECGYFADIEDGIIISNNVNINDKDIESEHIEKYIKETDPKHIDESYNSLEWLKKELFEEDLENKVIVEPGSGFGYFLRQVYDNLPESSYYICVDNNHELNKYLKSLLELSPKKANIIFITANLPDIPLKEDITDIIVDFTGTTNYCFNNKNFLPIELQRYYKDNIVYIAAFILYKKFGFENIIDPLFRENFKIENIKKKFNENQFKIIKEYNSKIFKIDKSLGKYEDYAQEGDKIFSYQIKAKR
ncbi:MAG: MerR family transcriptional regulator [Bacillota bacterium]